MLNILKQVNCVPPKTMKVLTITILTLILAASALAQNNLKVGAPAPPFSGVTLAGSDFDLSQQRGTVVVITFWSTRCEICHVEFPKLNRLIKGYEGKKVLFLSLTTDNEDKVEAYLKKNPLATQILPNSFGVLLQYADRDKNGNLDMGYPSYYVVNDAGTIEFRSSGYDKTPALNSALIRLLSK